MSTLPGCLPPQQFFVVEIDQEVLVQDCPKIGSVCDTVPLKLLAFVVLARVFYFQVKTALALRAAVFQQPLKLLQKGFRLHHGRTLSFARLVFVIASCFWCRGGYAISAPPASFTDNQWSAQSTEATSLTATKQHKPSTATIIERWAIQWRF